jgi:hypothetical protein
MKIIIHHSQVSNVFLKKYKKASESEKRRNLEKFGKTGIAADLLRKVKNTHKTAINCIKPNKGWSETRSGVSQGSVFERYL